MAYDDDQKGVVLPTREGTPQGAGQERVMLDAVGGPDAVRQRVIRKADGTEVTLRTRLGQPEFTASTAEVVAAPCLRGPFEEEASQFADRIWHAPMADMVSSDGIFQIPREPLRKISFMAGENPPKKLVEMHFASPSTTAQISSGAAGAIPIIESGYGDRLWHPKQMGRIVDMGLYFCMSRLRMLSLTCQKTNGKTPFKWWFSKEGDPDLTGALPICMNRNAQETGLGTRIQHALSQIKQFSIQVKTRVGAVITASPGGFLGGLDAEPVPGEDEFPPIVSDATDQVMNNLSMAHSCGQPWHGWMTSAGIETNTDPVNFPSGRVVSPSGYTAPDKGDTYYVAFPGLPAVSTSVPDDFAYNGMSYLQDAVFFDGSKRYSPITTEFTLGGDRWLHYNPTTKKVHVMRLEIVGATTFAGATVRIHKDGELTVRGVTGTAEALYEAFLSGPATLHDLNLSESSPVLYSVTTKSISFEHPLNPGHSRTFPFALNASQTGGRIVVCLYWYSILNGYSFIMSHPKIMAAWEIEIADDFSVITPTKVYSHENISGNLDVASYVSSFYVKSLLSVDYNPTSMIYTQTYELWEKIFVSGADEEGELDRRLIMAGYDSSDTLALTMLVDTIEYPPGTEVTLFDNYTPYTITRDWSSGDPGSPYDPTAIGEIVGYLGHTTYYRDYLQTTRIENPDYDLTSELIIGGNSYSEENYYLTTWFHAICNNVVLLGPENRNGSAVFVGTETVSDGSSLGYYYVVYPENPWYFGQASYDPRAKEIRWDQYKIGCV